MQILKNLILLTIMFTVIVNSTMIGQDEVLTGYNEQIQFDKLTPEYIEAKGQKTMDDLDKKLAEIYSVPVEMRNYDNTVLAYDQAVDGLNTVWGTLYLMANSHPDDATRNAADEVNVTFAKYGNELGLNEDLYNSFKEYSKTDEAKLLMGYKEKFLRETIRDFERNGFALSKEKRDELKEIQDRLSTISNEFSKNIGEYKDFLIVTEEEIKGLDDDYKNARREDDGTYKIDLTYPSIDHS
jgi:thimet oligopeptidase